MNYLIIRKVRKLGRKIRDIKGNKYLSCANMHINLDILKSYGATSELINKGQHIYQEGSEARYYYQIVRGSVKLVITNKDGRELIQNIFNDGDSFGEPALFANSLYISSTCAITETEVLKLPKEKYFKLIDDHPDIARKILQCIAKRLYDRAGVTQLLINNTPEEKILGFFNKLKAEKTVQSCMMIPYTRQQIADFTGLRVETVIRTLAKLKEQKKVDIVDHKVYY